MSRTPGRPPTPPEDVIVVNPNTQPVPVNGTIQVGNIVPTRLVDEPARQPFQRQVDLMFSINQPEAEVSLEVPQGRRLVIEYVSADATAATAITAGGIFPFPLLSLRTMVDGVSVNYPLVLPVNFGQEVRLGQLMRVYADPGRSVFFRANSKYAVSPMPPLSPPPVQRFTFGISGYLVNLT
jgi:hypothetical protein